MITNLNPKLQNNNNNKMRKKKKVKFIICNKNVQIRKETYNELHNKVQSISYKS